MDAGVAAQRCMVPACVDRKQGEWRLHPGPGSAGVAAVPGVHAAI